MLVTNPLLHEEPIWEPIYDISQLAVQANNNINNDNSTGVRASGSVETRIFRE